MEAERTERDETRAKARRLVDFWRNRQWLQSSSPLHVHPLDLDKLEDLIASALDERSG
jgi:hypothetical protein